MLHFFNVVKKRQWCRGRKEGKWIEERKGEKREERGNSYVEERVREASGGKMESFT